MKVERKPLFSDGNLTSVIAYHQGHFIERRQFLTHVYHVMQSLPDKRYAINLCEDRYWFLVSFVACMLRQQVSLLPPSRAELEIERLHNQYSGSYCLHDEDVAQLFESDQQLKETDIPFIPSAQLVAIVFTSGSSGTPEANPKYWGDLVSSARRVQEQLDIKSSTPPTSIVATVPAQHMFGFETTIIFPLVIGVSVHAGKPFYPQDVQQSLTEMPQPRILITTPIHLRACAQEELDWPEIDFILSATAPLSENTAAEAEQNMQTKVKEIYGCSEVGAIATRHTMSGFKWKLLQDYHLVEHTHGYHLKVPGKEPIELPDHFEKLSENKFHLVGRQTDMLNIGGKRGSLGDLNHKLKSIKGVVDGVFVLRDMTPGGRQRLAALVVAPGLSVKTILKHLSDMVDPVFLPRPLIKVAQLPFNETGKLPRREILQVLKQNHLEQATSGANKRH